MAVAILVLGGLVVVKPAVDHWDYLYRGDPFTVGTTTQVVQETSGKKVDRTRTTTKEDSSSFAERVLGDSGVLLSGSRWWRSQRCWPPLCCNARSSASTASGGPAFVVRRGPRRGR